MRRHPGLPSSLLLLVGLVVAAMLPAPAGAATPSQRAAERSLEEARAILAGHGDGEATLALAELHRRLPSLRADDRAEARELLARPTSTTDVDQDGDLGAWYGGDASTSFALEGGHFRIHYVTEAGSEHLPPTDDADEDLVPDYVERVAEVFEGVRNREVEDFGWTAPPTDVARGGDARTDVYLADVGSEDVYGYAGQDVAQEADGDPSREHAYMVMDNDYAEFDQGDDRSLKVTAAHEYNHVLQFGMRANMEPWALEATATWMEEQVFPEIDDYVQYVEFLAPAAPLTTYGDDGAPLTEYASSVFVHWFAARHQPGAVLSAWKQGTDDGLEAFSRAGDGFASDYADFAASLPEWQVPSGRFPDEEDAAWPEYGRASGDPLVFDGLGIQFDLDHASTAAFDVADYGDGPVQLAGELPDGVPGALILVGRTGSDPRSGTVVERVTKLPDGGAGKVTLDDAGSYGRITAVFVNAGRQGADGQRFSGAVGTPVDDAPAARTATPVQTVVASTDPGPVLPRALSLAEVDDLVAGALGGSVRGVRRLTVRRLARAASIAQTLVLPVAGTVSITWRAPIGRGGRRVTIARGRATGAAGQATTVRVRLTRAGRRLLRGRRAATTVTVASSFVGGPATAADPAVASTRVRLAR